MSKRELVAEELNVAKKRRVPTLAQENVGEQAVESAVVSGEEETTSSTSESTTKNPLEEDREKKETLITRLIIKLNIIKRKTKKTKLHEQFETIRRLRANDPTENKQNDIRKIEYRYEKEKKRIEEEESSRFNNFPTIVGSNRRIILLSMLGSGKIGDTYKLYNAFDLANQEKVACVAHDLTPKRNLKKILYEKNLSSNLVHENIIGFRDFINLEDKSVFFVFEYCRGGNLEMYLNEKYKNKLTTQETAEIFAQVADALKYLAALVPSPVLHLNVSPGGITDLCSYMPPECLILPNTLTTKVDIWSLGINLYRCIYGQVPFGNKKTSPKNVANEIQQGLKYKQIVLPKDRKINSIMKDLIRDCLLVDANKKPDIAIVCEQLDKIREMKCGVDEDA